MPASVLAGTFYLGAGLHAFSHVHVDDLGDLVVRAVESGRAGAVYHASNGELSFRTLAEAVARNLGVDAQSVSPRDVSPIMKPEMVAAMSGRSLRISSLGTRNELAWNPQRQDLIHDIIAGSYHPAHSKKEDEQ
jgi:nucleoside-diphosphate-sugar epimerase